MVSEPQNESEGAAKGTYGEARSIGADMADIAADLRDLAQKEVQLAKAEVREQVRLLGRAMILGTLAAIHVLLLLTFLFLGAMFALDTVLDLWAAALITAGFIAILTATAALVTYLMFKRFHVIPQRTVRTIREDLEWGRNRLKLSAR